MLTFKLDQTVSPSVYSVELVRDNGDREIVSTLYTGRLKWCTSDYFDSITKQLDQTDTVVHENIFNAFLFMLSPGREQYHAVSKPLWFHILVQSLRKVYTLPDSKTKELRMLQTFNRLIYPFVRDSFCRSQDGMTREQKRENTFSIYYIEQVWNFVSAEFQTAYQQIHKIIDDAGLPYPTMVAHEMVTYSVTMATLAEHLCFTELDCLARLASSHVNAALGVCVR